MKIESASNDKIKEIKKLLAKSSYRKEKGLFVVEGPRMFVEIPPQRLHSVYVSETCYEHEKDMFAHVPEDKLYIIRNSIFEAVSATKTPQGILALVAIEAYNSSGFLSRALEDDVPFLLLIECLQDPGNLGTILRTAEAAGVTGVLLSPDTVDLYNPKVVRSSMGSVFRLPVRIAEDFYEEAEEIKKRGVVLFGAHLSGDAFFDKDFHGPCGFLIGNEGQGLSDKVSTLADALLRIPMKGSVESLNAAISAAVISYEVLRQRR